MKYVLTYERWLVAPNQVTVLSEELSIIKQRIDYRCHRLDFFDQSVNHAIVDETGKICCTFNLENRWIFDLWMNSFEND